MTSCAVGWNNSCPFLLLRRYAQSFKNRSLTKLCKLHRIQVSLRRNRERFLSSQQSLKKRGLLSRVFSLYNIQVSPRQNREQFLHQMPILAPLSVGQKKPLHSDS